MVENCPNFENIMGRGIGASFPLPLLALEPSAEDELIAKKRRKRTVARFVALTTSAADKDRTPAAAAATAESHLTAQTLDRII
jgi:hypothetical protein